MPRVLRTYQQNFIGDTTSDSWTFRFASIPHKAKKNNRFKVSVSSLSSYVATATASASLKPQIFWMKGLANSVAFTASGNTTSVNVTQVSNATILGICGNGLDVNTISATNTIYSNSFGYSPYSFYLDEMPTTDFNIFYTALDTYTYTSSAADLTMLLSLTIEEESE